MPGVGTIAPGGIGVLRTLAPRTGSDGTVTKGGVDVDAGESCAALELGISTVKATTKKTASPKTRADRRAVRQTLCAPWTSTAIFAPRSAVPCAGREHPPSARMVQ